MFPAVLFPACVPSSLTFCMVYTAYWLNKQGDNTQPCCTPFPVLNQSFLPCLILLLLLDLHTDFSGGRSGGLVVPSLEDFSTVCCDPHSQRLWHSQESRSRCFSGTLLLFDDPVDVGYLISGSSALSKTSLNIWKFLVHILLKLGLENFEHYFTSV